MGKWGYGPFDNDGAADFAGDLDAAPPSRRIQAIRAALASVAGDSSPHIDGGSAELAIAAAALTVRGVEGGDEFQSATWGPSGEIPEIPKELVSLALEAISRLLATSNDLRDDWSVEEEGAEWLAMLRRLKEVLDRESTAGFPLSAPSDEGQKQGTQRVRRAAHEDESIQEGLW
ncbi:DUF4259 domain-containing protein [Streptomyces sp. Vc74B-19]|uniref:DUF4259 domain-containing protein n=1 Tax=Streptomyces sp. Vc74B-19 TaxID=2741324 RepID=UPI001BFC8B6C|nr:DUF4259 domain-containing protein [Streptomyces sp. Vc74B-19]MBT3161506.1 DUF4259 domain-containing protein [Streptomyces sp. Vc74B-19]